MKTAHLIINGDKTLVDACDVVHSDFSKIFQCPYCKQSLYLREGYYREGNRVNPAFVHSEGDPRDCRERAKYNREHISHDVFSIIKLGQGQSNKKLEKAFFDCLQNSFQGSTNAKIYGSKRAFSQAQIKKQIDFNSRPYQVSEEPELFIEVLSKIIKNRKCGSFLMGSVSDFKLFLTSKKSKLTYLIEKSDIEQIEVDILINQHCAHLLKILQYLCFGSSETLRKNVLRFSIWCDYINLPVSPVKIETIAEKRARRLELKDKAKQSNGNELIRFHYNSEKYYLSKEEEEEAKINEKREPRIREIQQFTPEILLSTNNDESMINTFFAEFYEQKETIGSDLIRFVLTRLIKVFKVVNWWNLPIFYNKQSQKFSHQKYLELLLRGEAVAADSGRT
jgi:hypothetical protein